VIIKHGESTPWHFHGSPHLVESLVPLPAHVVTAKSSALDLQFPSSFLPLPQSLSLQSVQAGSSATRLRFSLPETSPPGTYEGTVQIGDDTYPIVVRVDPFPYLMIILGCAVRQWSGSLTTQPIFVIRCEPTGS